MLRRMLKSKIQQIRVTHKELYYAGSLAVDMDLYDAADIKSGESVHIYNMSNGERLETYAIPAPRGSGIVSIKGAACRKMEIGDEILVVSFADYSEEEVNRYRHKIVFVDSNNKLDRIEERTDNDYLPNT
ncbi:MAG TPA: aspartate 1-decarboxylase [bacterium]|nr:aspartate 1-decarboxylase [bacterium]HQL62302.1 aspartate 1-decarboxylase [bacterium]